MTPMSMSMPMPNELSAGAQPAEPLAVLERWIAEARNHRVQPNPNAMVLATCDAEGRPSARVMLCKGVSVEPGYLTFYANYQSRKGRELAANGRAAGAHRGTGGHGSAGRQRWLFCLAPVAEPDRGMGERTERARRIPSGA